MKAMPKGFSLIELMIVIAIIGVLAGIAVPSYQNYVMNAKTGEMLSAIGAAELAVNEYIQTTGATNCNNMPQATFPTSANIASIGIDYGGFGIPTCGITVQGVTSEFAGVTTILYGIPTISNGSITWEIKSNGTKFVDKYPYQPVLS